VVDRRSVAARLLCSWFAGAVAVIAVVAVVAGGAFAADNHAIGGDRYEGRTSQGQATVIVVSASGRTVTALLTAVTYDGLCGKRSDPAYQISSTSKAAIGPDGTFAMTTRSTTAGPGSLAMRVTGIFSGTTVHGTIAETGPKARCAAPRARVNPYQATFTAKGTPAAAP
jgi:hypothetical protein